MEIITKRFGSIHPKTRSNCGLGDTIPGKELEWIFVNGMFIAARNIKYSVSWERLNREGLVFGKKIIIDGKQYNCRLLCNDPKEGGCREWEDILCAIGTEEATWHWNGKESWVQETSKSSINEGYHAVLGHNGVPMRSYISPDTISRSIGWRPVLEPVNPIPSNIHTMIGANVVVKSQGSTVHGKLESISTYDMLLHNAKIKSFGDNFKVFALNLPDGSIVIDLSKIDFILPLET